MLRAYLLTLTAFQTVTRLTMSNGQYAVVIEIHVPVAEDLFLVHAGKQIRNEENAITRI